MSETRRIPSEPEKPVLNSDEVDYLVGIAVAHSRHGPPTEEELDCVLQWARKSRVDHGLLELVLGGLLVMTWDRDAHTVRFWAIRPEDQA